MPAAWQISVALGLFHLVLCPLKLIIKSVGFLCSKIDQDRKQSLHFCEEYFLFFGKQPPVKFLKYKLLFENVIKMGRKVCNR